MTIRDEMERLGPIGLPYVAVGQVVQAMATILVDRGHDEKQVIDRLLSKNFDEDDLWMDVVGPAIDDLAEALGLPPYPEPEL